MTTGFQRLLGQSCDENYPALAVAALTGLFNVQILVKKSNSDKDNSDFRIGIFY